MTSTRTTAARYSATRRAEDVDKAAALLVEAAKLLDTQFRSMHEHSHFLTADERPDFADLARLCDTVDRARSAAESFAYGMLRA